jgi:hypothetical protein
MTVADLIAKKLAFIEDCVRELREEAHPQRIGIRARLAPDSGRP